MPEFGRAIGNSEVVMTEQGHKNDSEKLRYELIPAEAMDMLAEVYTIGAKKYADDNWRQGLNFRRVIGAMLRHAFAYSRRETRDPDDGQHHLAAVAWCAFTLMVLEIEHPELDDRWVPA